MRQYQDLLKRILETGVQKGDRTGTGTISVFGHQMRFDLADGFPLVTTKKIHLKAVIHELLWFLKGSTNIAYLKENGVKIWNEWADENGELGPVYGAQWRSWGSYTAEFDKDVRPGDTVERNQRTTIDQIANVVEAIRSNPNSRRLIVTAWNPAEVELCALPPCHVLFQFYVANGKLSCQLYQRSCDVFLGVPFNIASYALLTMMIAKVCGLKLGEFIWTGGDCHLYLNHLDQAREQLSREPRELPQMMIRHAADIDSFTYEHFGLLGYDPHPAIKAEISV